MFDTTQQEINRHLLRCHLQFAYFIIQEFATGQRILRIPRPDLAQCIAEHGDALMFKSPHTKKVLAALLEGVALMSFCPGGVTVLGDHFEATPEQVAAAWRWAEEYGEAVAATAPVGEWAWAGAAALPPPKKALPDTPPEETMPVSPTFQELFREDFSKLLEGVLPRE